LPFATTYVYVTILDVPFWLSIYLALLLVARPPSSRVWKIADVGGAALAAFSGVASIVLAPLYLATIRRRPAVSLVVIAGAAAELAALFMSSRRPALIEPVNVVVTAGSRMLTVPFGDLLGYKLFVQPTIAVAAMAAIAIAFWFARRSLPLRTVAVLMYISVAIAFMGTLGLTNSLDELRHPSNQGRYFVATAWTILLVGTAGLTGGLSMRPRIGRLSIGRGTTWRPTVGWSKMRRLAMGRPTNLTRPAGLALCLALAVGLWSTARVIGIKGPEWACVGSSTPCTVNTVVWPGDPSQFRLPVGVQPSGWTYPK
jgi:hypothetical protein